MAFLKILKGFFETKFFRKVKERKGNEIYVFLALLCKYEIDNDKMHARFVIFFFFDVKNLNFPEILRLSRIGMTSRKITFSRRLKRSCS